MLQLVSRIDVPLFNEGVCSHLTWITMRIIGYCKFCANISGDVQENQVSPPPELIFTMIPDFCFLMMGRTD